MKVTKLCVLMCALSVCSVAWSASNDVKGIDIIIKKKPNGGASLHADQISSNSATAQSRAVKQKGVSGNISAGGDVVNTDTESVNNESSVSSEITSGEGDVTAPQTTKTINISRSNIKENAPIFDNTVDGDINYTEANTRTNTITNENTGGNVVSNTHLCAVVSGNSVLVDGRSLDNTEATVAVMGNSIGSNAFEGVSGVTVINMNDGHSSNVQSSISIMATPAH
jgi:hypothetical protein